MLGLLLTSVGLLLDPLRRTHSGREHLSRLCLALLRRLLLLLRGRVRQLCSPGVLHGSASRRVLLLLLQHLPLLKADVCRVIIDTGHAVSAVARAEVVLARGLPGAPGEAATAVSSQTLIGRRLRLARGLLVLVCKGRNHRGGHR